MKKASLIDANLILRYFLNDIPVQAQSVETLLKTSKEKLILNDLTIAEIVWVLNSIYKIPKPDIVEKIRSIINVRKLTMNRRLLLKTLSIYEKHNISFADAYLSAISEIEKLDGIYSFDRGLDKVKSIKRKEP